MRYADLKKNDIVNGTNVCVSFWTQGCPHRCYQCHNPETWSFEGGKEFTIDTLQEIISAINAHGIQRNFSVLGGEPLCEENLFLTNLVITEVRKHYPDIIIYLWTGYIYEDLLEDSNPYLKNILDNIDILIDGPFIQEQRDITLHLRGSKNQRILFLKS